MFRWGLFNRSFLYLQPCSSESFLYLQPNNLFLLLHSTVHEMTAIKWTVHTCPCSVSCGHCTVTLGYCSFWSNFLNVPPCLHVPTVDTTVLYSHRMYYQLLLGSLHLTDSQQNILFAFLSRTVLINSYKKWYIWNSVLF